MPIPTCDKHKKWIPSCNECKQLKKEYENKIKKSGKEDLFKHLGIPFPEKQTYFNIVIRTKPNPKSEDEWQLDQTSLIMSAMDAWGYDYIDQIQTYTQFSQLVFRKKR